MPVDKHSGLPAHPLRNKEARKKQNRHEKKENLKGKPWNKVKRPYHLATNADKNKITSNNNYCQGVVDYKSRHVDVDLHESMADDGESNHSAADDKDRGTHWHHAQIDLEKQQGLTCRKDQKGKQPAQSQNKGFDSDPLRSF